MAPAAKALCFAMMLALFAATPSASADDMSPDVANPNVDLIGPKRRMAIESFGKDPSERVHYAIQSDAVTEYRLRVKTTTTVSFRGKSSPATAGTMEVVLTLVADTGSPKARPGKTRLKFFTRATKITSGKQTAEDIAKFVDTLPPLTGAFALDDRGTVTDLEVTHVPAKDTIGDAIRREIEALVADAIERSLFVPFPRGLLGVGARWSVTEPVERPGKAKQSRTTRYALRKIDARSAVVAIEATESADPQTVVDADRNEWTIVRFDGKSSGDAAVTFDGLKVARKSTGGGHLELDDTTVTKTKTEMQIDPLKAKP